MEVKQLGTDEGLLYRDLRLRALEDAPDAFGDTLAEALTRPEQSWIDRAHELALDSEREVLFMAWERSRPRGSIYVRLDDATAHIYGMWVEPAMRRLGVGASLMAAGLSWARQRGASQAGLWVTDGNLPALRLYQSCGFRETGQREPIRPGSALLVRQMILQLDDNPI
jgi:ribosomal protein S18 acetylase RimI-like enzyme